MKLRDKDVENLIRWLDERRDELKENIKESFVSLKNDLKRENWEVSVVDCENLIEDLVELSIVELFLEKIKDLVET